METLKHYDESFAIIKILIQIFETIPVITVSPESSFLSFGHLKNNMSLAMGRERLYQHFYNHSKMSANISKVLNILSRISRRINLDDRLNYMLFLNFKF